MDDSNDSDNNYRNSVMEENDLEIYGQRKKKKKFFLTEEEGKRKKKIPSSRIRTSDLRITS